MGPADLAELLRGLTAIHDPNLLSGTEDDAAVYKLTEDLAVVVSVDYFTPIVRDAYTFGQISAANALSDIYAMGAKPIIALNIVCFPAASMGLVMLKEVLRGSLDKLREAGVLPVGGHTLIDPKEIKYGLSVVGTVDPKKILTKGGLEKRNKLILTKALGTGIINNALKGQMLDEDTELKVAQSMATLNKKASEIALEAGIRACTDITGFGLAGHLLEMIRESQGVGIELDASSLPLFPRVEEFAKTGLIPPGSKRNRTFQEGKISFSSDIPDWKRWIVFDAQTSGGLILSARPQETDSILRRLHEEGMEEARVIGTVMEDPEGRIVINSRKTRRFR